MDKAALRIYLFGSIELAPCNLGTAHESLERSSLDLSSSKARSLLAYLIVHHDRPLPRDRLAGQFWPDRSDAQARRALSQALWRIRSALGPAADRVVTEQDVVVFRLRSGDEVDVEAFERQVNGHVAGTAGSPLPEQIRILSQAVDLYRADFLEECYDDWALLERERLRECYLRALERLVTLHKRQGTYAQALIYAQRLVAADPLREAAHRELMRLYYLLDRPRAALEQFAGLERLLRDELDVTPARATVALYREIAGGLGELSAPYLPTSLPPSPLLHDLAHLPFIGRRDERTRLLDALQAAGKGRGGVALVEGDAGVGKTRLVNEVAADAAWRGFQVGAGKVDPVVATASYQLLRDALASLLTPLRLVQIAKMLPPRRLKDVAPLLPVVDPYVTDQPSPRPLSPQEERERLWDGVVHVLNGLSTAAPLLLILEDIHGADDATLLALPHIISRLYGDRVLVVLSYRSAEARERPLVWQTLENLSQSVSPLRIVLSPFTRDDATYLVERALANRGTEDRLADFARRLHQETGGNSFFLIEILRALLESGALSTDSDGLWVFPPQDQPLPTPASIRDLIDNRLARLAPGLQDTLRRVAVLGENTSFVVLSHISDRPVDQLVEGLRELSQRGFLVETETGYRFEHDLLQEAVYRNIDPAQLAGLHRRVGEALEAMDPDRTASMAFHFHRGQVPEKALTYALRAAEQALAVYDYEAALAHYRRAHELTEDDPRQRWDLLSRTRHLLRILGRYNAHRAAIDEMLQLAQEIGDAAIRARTLFFVGNMQQISGIPSEALETLREALALIPAGTQQKLVGQILLQIAYAHWRLGNVAQCQTKAEEALTIFRSIEDREEQVCVLRFLNNLHVGITGDYAAGLACSEESRRFSLETGDAYLAATDLGNVALARILLGDYEGAQEPLHEALDFMSEIGDYDIRGGLLIFQAINDRCLGRLDEARKAGLQALEVCRQAADTNFEIEALSKLGLVAVAEGDLEEARSWFVKAVTLAESSEQALDCAENRSHLAFVEARLGNWDEALDLSEDAVAVMEAAHEVSDRLKTTYWERAQILRLAGDPAAASHFVERAYATLMAVAERVSDPGLRRSFLDNVAENRSIVAAHRRGHVPLPTRRLSLRLPRIDAPTGRPLEDDEHIEVAWTLSAPEDDEIDGKVNRRRHRILRLLREATEQSAAPTLDDLAEALDVSVSTIKRDVAALRRAGHEVSTRGSREP